jgi:hypothetical protein
MKDLMFSERFCWRFSSSVMWHCVIGWVVPDISKEHNVFICTDRQSSWSPCTCTWRHYNPLQHQELLQWPHSSTSQKTWIFCCLLSCIVLYIAGANFRPVPWTARSTTQSGLGASFVWPTNAAAWDWGIQHFAAAAQLHSKSPFALLQWTVSNNTLNHKSIRILGLGPLLSTGCLPGVLIIGVQWNHSHSYRNTKC